MSEKQEVNNKQIGVRNEHIVLIFLAIVFVGFLAIQFFLGCTPRKKYLFAEIITMTYIFGSVAFLLYYPICSLFVKNTESGSQDINNNSNNDSKLKEPVKALIFFAAMISVILFAFWVNPATNIYEAGNDTGIQALFPNAFLIVSVIILVITGLLWFLARKKTLYIQALILVIGMGFIVIFMIPPFAGPDETAHYSLSYKISNIITGNSIDNYNSIDDIHSFADYTVHCSSNTSFIRVLNELNDENTYTPADIFEPVNDITFPMPYLASGLIILLFRCLGGGFIWVYYGGRIVNLIVYAALSSLAVRIAPKFKSAILLVALSPIALQQAGSFSYDSLIIASSLLYVSIILYYIYEKEKVTTFDVVLLLIVALLFMPVKIVYVVMALMILLIPRDKFESQNRRIAYLALVLIINLVMAVVVMRGSINLRTTADVSGNYTITYILGHFRESVRIIFNNIIRSWWGWFTQMFGHYMAGYSVEILGEAYSVLILLFIVSGIQRDKDYPAFDIWQKCIVGFVIIGVLGATVLSMFLLTGEGEQIISGVQGRYFLPIMFPMLFILNSEKIKIELDGIDNILIGTYIFDFTFVLSYLASGVSIL